MRGKEDLSLVDWQVVRITPAYAGKSLIPNIFLPISKDHPRVCGEKNTSIKIVKLYIGSPPRMRGKGVLLFFSISCYRITPAYAGKSVVAAFVAVVNEDHPRVCGEKAEPR